MSLVYPNKTLAEKSKSPLPLSLSIAVSGSAHAQEKQVHPFEAAIRMQESTHKVRKTA